MSTIDEKKEKSEYQCLIDAYDFCVNNSVPLQTKNILKYLNGECVIRDKNDAPDIINICLRNGNQKVIVGIEHFNVSSISKTTSTGKNISLCKMHLSNLSKINDKMVKQKCEEGFISDALIDENTKEIGSLAEDALNGTYESFITSFKTAWNKHTSNVDNYIKRITTVAEEKGIKEIEIAFLIEIDSEFLEYFCNYSDGSIDFVNTGLIPVFKEIIALINSTDNRKKINYIIFYNKNVNKSCQSVIAFRTGSIKSNLQKQGISIFEYIGENCSKVVIDNIDHKDITLDFHLDGYTYDDIKYKLLPLYRKAASLKRKHIPFVADRGVQHLLYVDPDNCPDKNTRHRKSKKFSKTYSKDKK